MCGVCTFTCLVKCFLDFSYKETAAKKGSPKKAAKTPTKKSPAAAATASPKPSPAKPAAATASPAKPTGTTTPTKATPGVKISIVLHDHLHFHTSIWT